MVECEVCGQKPLLNSLLREIPWWWEEHGGKMVCVLCWEALSETVQCDFCGEVEHSFPTEVPVYSHSFADEPRNTIIICHQCREDYGQEPDNTFFCWECGRTIDWSYRGQHNFNDEIASECGEFICERCEPQD